MRGKRVKYKECFNQNVTSIYKQHYKNINGGIDGYYEKTILNSQMYEVYTHETLAFFSVHPERGLTSLVVLPNCFEMYDRIFTYVLDLPLFSQILFSENDKHFMYHIKKNNIQYDIQSYNFEAHQKIVSSIQMNIVKKEDITRLNKEFGEFIDYNRISLESNKSFYYAKDDNLVSFGALEPLKLNENRYCISMIVSEKYRNKGFGCETVKFLIEYLQSNNFEVNARCYVHNEASKKTLLKSGLHISNLLYKATK